MDDIIPNITNYTEIYDIIGQELNGFTYDDTNLLISFIIST